MKHQPNAKKLRKYNYISQLKPFQLILQDGAVCSIESFIQFVPYTRITGFGKWNNKEVFIKLFFHRFKSKFHFSQDTQGVQILLNHKILTPNLYFVGEVNGISIAIFEKLSDVKNLYQMLPLNQETLAAIQLTTKSIATQHQLGIYQKDPNSKNYLIKKNQVYSIDGFHILQFETPVSLNKGLENLAVFLSHFGLPIKEYLPDLLRTYCHERQFDYSAELQTHFDSLLDNRFKNHIQRLNRKIITRNTKYIPFGNFQLQGLLDRKFGNDDVLRFLMQINSNKNIIFEKIDAYHQLATFKIGKYTFYVKKILPKNFFDLIKEFFLPSLGKKAWHEEHKHYYLALTTIKPVAFIQRRMLGRFNCSYYVGIDLGVETVGAQP